MTKFTLSLLAAAVLASTAATSAKETDLAAAANATPKVTAAARTISPAKEIPARALRKAAKKAGAKAIDGKSRARRAGASGSGIIYECSFAFLTEGTETAPAALELDDWDNIPEELVGEANYGFGGQGLMQAGGAVYIPFEYADPDDPDWYLEGMLWTPDIYEPMEVTVELDAKIAEESEVDTDYLWVYATDYSNIVDYDDEDITTEWKHLTFTIDAKDFVAESDDDSYYLTIFAEEGADILIKNVVIKGEQAELQVPTAQSYTDFTGTSFTAHWSAVEGATGYYLTVYNFDPTTRENTSTVLEDQFTENNYYTVGDLTPGGFYSYQVAATNGSFTTSASNRVLVCELPSPTGVTLTAGDYYNTLEAEWTATPGANYYVVTATSSHTVAAGETITLADADFCDVQSTGTVAEPEESEYWYDSMPQLPGWEFTLGCSVPGAYGFWDNAQYTAWTGLQASLASMDYDLSNVKDGTVNVTVEAASPGNGMLAGMLSFDESEGEYTVASAYGTPENVPSTFETYTFALAGAAARSQFLFMTRTDDGSDGAILIRTLKITAEAKAAGTVGVPVGTLETEATRGTFDQPLESGVSYSAVVVPYLVDDEGYILAVGRASEAAVFVSDHDGIIDLEADKADTRATYYNLQGRKIDNPAKGTVVIKVAGGKAAKVLF